MQFARPEWLWLLAAVPLWALRAARGRARRDRAWARLGQLGRPSADGAGWCLSGLVCLIVGLAGPRWGAAERPPLPPGHDVVLVIDVSRSMGAKDAVPDRIGVAVESAVSLVQALGTTTGDRVAVVAFAGKGVLRCPLTENLGAAVATLRALRPGSVRPGGTDLAAGLRAAIDAFDDQDHAEGRAVVLFSDGEDHASAWKSVLDRLTGQGTVVHTVAVGDDETGHDVPTRPGVDPTPITHEGQVVRSKREDAALETVAVATGGRFIPLGLAPADLGLLYRTRIEPDARARRTATLSGERAERFSVFLLAGLAFFLVGLYPRRARLKFVRRSVRVVMAAGLAAIAVLNLGAGQPKKSAAGWVASGLREYQSGRFEEAAGAFREAVAVGGSDPVPSYNLAAALFQLGRYEEASSLYAETRARATPGLRTKIDFALGNVALALGNLSESITHYDECLASTATGEGLDRVRQDARINRAFVEEQAKRSVAPPPEGSQPPTEGRKKPDAPKGQGDDTDSGSGGSESPPGAGEPSKADDPTSRPDPRGPGGAGGGGPAPAPSEATTAGEQLAKAMDNVREARKRRLDESPPAWAADHRKDW